MHLLGPQPEVEALVSFQGLAGRFRALGTNQGSAMTNQGPAEPIRILRKGSEPHGANYRAPHPQDVSGHRDGSGPEGRARAPQNKSTNRDRSGSCETNQSIVSLIKTPRDGAGSRGMEQAAPGDGTGRPAVRIRVIWDGSETNQDPGTDWAPQNVSMSHGTSQGPEGRIRDPVGQTKAPQDDSGFRGTDEAPAGPTWALWTNQSSVNKSGTQRTNQDPRHIGVKREGPQGAMAPSLFSQHYS